MFTAKKETDPMAKETKIPVARRAAAARVTRALKQRGQRIHCSRRGWRSTYAIIDAATNTIVKMNLSLEDLAREIGVLEPFETIAGPQITTYAPTVKIEAAKVAKRTRKVARRAAR
jgi:hypothetical protein